LELFKLKGIIELFGADKAKNEIDETTDHAERKGSKLLSTMAKIGTAAIAAGGAAVVAIGKQALSSYADYEQLVGGVDTLFKDSSAKVQEYAANAYKTAGLSANEYMDTVTSFSASLLQSLGGDTEAAADMANVAITDMSDNANKMGTDMASIQNAYQGFAKQNYTMLDNLKLGYGGTKEEMERLLADASKLSGKDFLWGEDGMGYGYAEIVEAIHVVQTEMGITGTTAKEASTTIQGSVSSMKSAWGNLLVGIADDNADFKTLTEQFVDSLVTVGKNIIPRISVILGGISQLVTSASTTIIPMVITTITDNLPALLQAAVALVGALGQGIIDSLPAITQAAIDIIFYLADSLIANLPTLIAGLLQVTMTIVQTLTSPEFLTQLVETAILLIMTLANGLIDAIPQLIAAVPLIIGNLLAAIIVELPNIIQMGIDLLFALIDGIIKCIPELVAAVPTLIIAFINGIVNNLDKIILAAPQIIVSLITGIIGAIPELIAAVPRVIAAIADTIRNYDWGGIGRNIVQGLKDGIAGMWDNIKNWFNEKVDSLVGGVKRILGIRSPSKVFAGIGGFMAEGLGEGFSDEFSSVKKDIESNMSFDAGTITADANISRHYTSGSYGAASTSGGGDSGRIVMLLEQYLPMLANMKVIMDSGQVVGLLAPGMDEELAKINARRARAV
jgi:phage-related protein